MGREGWTFNKSEGSTGDDVNGKNKLSEIYLLANPRYSGRVSVPVLWDKKRETIVNNESSEIIRILNSAFDDFTNVHNDYYPKNLRVEIDRFNDMPDSTVKLCEGADAILLGACGLPSVRYPDNTEIMTRSHVSASHSLKFLGFSVA